MNTDAKILIKIPTNHIKQHMKVNALYEQMEFTQGMIASSNPHRPVNKMPYIKKMKDNNDSHSDTYRK